MDDKWQQKPSGDQQGEQQDPASGGNDTITGLAGIDSVFGDDGNDSFITAGSDDDDVIDGGAGSNTVDGLPLVPGTP